MEGSRVTAHPLDTSLILDCIFKNLRVSDLKRCRQVNRLWHEAATVSMRPAVMVKFGSELELDSEDRMQDFLEVVQSELSTFSTMPFANTFYLWDVPLDHPEFWAFCGSSIKTLSLWNISFDPADIFRHIIFHLCPNLENLVLCNVMLAGFEDEDHAEDAQEDDEQEPLVWIEPQFPQNLNLKRLELSDIDLGDISFVELFSYFPSLEEVHFGPVEDSRRLYRSLATCREHDPQSWKIKNISFDFDEVWKPESDLQFLFDVNLSLETVEVLVFHQTEHASSVIKKILSAHATTLKSLRIHGPKAAEIFDSPFDTTLEKVEDLSLEETQIASPRFLRKFPNLKKLKLICCSFSLEPESSEEQLNHWIVSSCTEFTVDVRESVLWEWTEENMFPLFRRIPNVEKLSVYHCTNELFAGICEIFQNLVSMKLELSEVNDCGISGLDKEDVERVNKEASEGRDLWRPVSGPRPNLSFLKTLKWFHYQNYDGMTLGYCAAQYGVLQLPQLQHLKVERSEEQIWDRWHEQFPWRNP